MSFLNALSWPMWGVLGIIAAALISLYFLKLRRKPVEISSTLLWRKTLEEMHVNSLWQRIRNNLLLWLQLLVLALIAIACLRPGWQGTRTIGTRTVIVLDQSASMQAVELGTTRLDIAKSNAKQLVSEMREDDVAMVVAFSDRVDVRHGFTKEKKKLLEAIDSINVTNRVSDVSELMPTIIGLLQGTEMTGANSRTNNLSNSDTESSSNQAENSSNAISGDSADEGSGAGEIAEPEQSSAPKQLPSVVIISDGGYGVIPDEEQLPVHLQFISVGSTLANNVAITSFSIQRNELKPDTLEAFARIANYTEAEVALTASLEIDGELTDANSIQIEPRQETAVSFELSNVQSGILKLLIDYEDDLELDNVAYAALRPSDPISVLLVTDGNSPLELALRTERLKQISKVEKVSTDYLTSAEYQTRSLQGSFDLMIFDRCSPAQIPNASTLYLGAFPPNSVAMEGDATASGATNSLEGDKGDQSGNATERNVPESTAVTTNGALQQESLDEVIWNVGQERGPLNIIDVDHTHPITQFLEMSSVAILSGQSVTPPVGGTELILGNHGPLFSIASRGRFTDAVMGFPLLRIGTDSPEGKTTEPNTDWTTKRSFPVFVYSVVNLLGGGHRSSNAKSVQPGKPAMLDLPVQFRELTIQAPGEANPIKASWAGDSSFVFTQTEDVGVYSITNTDEESSAANSASNENSKASNDTTIEYLCVNLFSNLESNLTVKEEIQVGDSVVQNQTQEILGRSEFWPWVILACLGVLLLEWFVFSRRVL